MRTMKNNILLFVLFGLSIGCAKQAPLDPENQGREVVVFGAFSQASGRADDQGGAELTGLQFVSKEGTGTDFRQTNPFSGDCQKDGRINFSERQTYNTASTASLFLASYFPQGNHTDQQVEWTINGSDDIMLAPSVDLGTQVDPIFATINYAHQLGQLEVVCRGKAGVTADQLAARWGKITSIKLCGTPVLLSLSLEEWVARVGSQVADLNLWSNDYTTPFVPIDIPTDGSTTPSAAGLFAPWFPAQTGLVLEVNTELETKRIAIDFGEAFCSGQRHTVTLLFNAAQQKEIEVLQTKVVEWEAGFSADAGVEV